MTDIKINLALIDDEELFIEGLSALLSNDASLDIVITSNDGGQFLENLALLAEDSFPDIALIDIQMKPMDGFELVELARKQYPNLKIIILSSHYKNNVLGHMIKLGVSAFLPKNTKREKLTEAIHSVYQTGVFFTAEGHLMLQAYMNSSSRQTRFTAIESLSEREIEVVKLICSENTNQEIADLLFLSKRTVESHRQRILEKTGAKNAVGIVVYAIAHGIYSSVKYL